MKPPMRDCGVVALPTRKVFGGAWRWFATAVNWPLPASYRMGSGFANRQNRAWLRLQSLGLIRLSRNARWRVRSKYWAIWGFRTGWCGPYSLFVHGVHPGRRGGLSSDHVVRRIEDPLDLCGER